MPIIGDVYETPDLGMGLTLPNWIVILKLLYDWSKLFIKRQLLQTMVHEYNAVNKKLCNDVPNLLTPM